MKVEMELSKQKEYNKLQALRMENLQKENEEIRNEYREMILNSKKEWLKMLQEVKGVKN